jgi:beta-aspartyl-peptidase (threonine type)
MSAFSIAIHGGAGTILRSKMTKEKELAYTNALDTALAKGFRILEKDGDAVQAVLAAVKEMEDHELFNAGKGSVFGADGKQEMDASIMDGKNLMAGAIAAVRNVRNPVELAYRVMMESEHVMLTGEGAKQFAISKGMTIEPDEYFYTEHRFKQLKSVQGSDETALDHNISTDDKKFGTVGAVACDQQGNIAAATSTGGMTNKKFGRVGDSPIIGAGTYANNKTCAISCTGHGEPFIRAVTAYDISCLMEYKGLSLHDAMHIVVHDKLMKLDGEGGMIGVDAKGNVSMQFNSEGMYRALQKNTGEKEISIYR